MSSFEKPALTVGGGLEVLAANTVPLRGGYIGDLKRDRHSISLGVGYTDRSVGIDVSLQQTVKGGDETRVIGGIRYYVR
jgi:hypothetical protein